MLLWFIYSNCFQLFTEFDFKNFGFFIAAAYLFFGILLVAGGFMQKPVLTVTTGLFIFIIPIVQIIRVFPKDLSQVLLIYLIPLSVGFYFFTNGNGE
jgi:hypothetical protein